ncbi:MAG: DUF3341 domain-containing protein [Polyangiales bacterium]
MNKSILAIMDSQHQAESIVSELQQAGFSQSSLSVLFPDQDGTRDFAHEHHTKAPEGALAGVGAGGALGGAVGVLAGLGALAIPGAGAFLAVGPIFAALSGVAAGAALGGITGALVGMGIPEIHAKRYEGKIRGGNILMAVHVDDRDAQAIARSVLERGGAHDIVSVSEAPVPT